MVLQSELIDDDIEHFEDVIDDDANETAAYEANNLHPESGQEKAGNRPSSEMKNAESLLPGGYDQKKREPLYCNADRTSWWELVVLASHVHPSVSTMARTLLSGVHIVYNGNPLVDLSLTAFLNKFMEKKPKSSTWHGASDIEPTKKMDMNNHLIGADILSLAESDVSPEDLVFHKFYANKSSSNKSKKKKLPEDEDAEDILGEEDDLSDNEEIDSIIDSTMPSKEESDGEYDYDDLDNVDDDDDDLIGQASDDEAIDFPGGELDDDADGDADVIPEEDGDDDDDDDEAFATFGEEDDDDDDDEAFATFGEEDDDEMDVEDKPSKNKKRKAQKLTKHSSASPFASIEDYEHIINKDIPQAKASSKDKKEHKKTKKRRKSSD